MANRDLTPWRTSSAAPGFGRDPFASFRREMDRLFDDFFAPVEARSFAGPAPQTERALSPSIDVHETEQAYTVSAELPGIDPKDVRLDLSDNALTLSGEKRSERREGDRGRRYTERTYGRFERTIPLPSEVDADKVEASYDNGVLQVVLPKNVQARDKSRRIEIRGAAGGDGQAQVGAPSGAGAPPAPEGDV